VTTSKITKLALIATATVAAAIAFRGHRIRRGCPYV
jgi:hypothetical protein